MSLVIEDGAGNPLAESYVSAEDCAAYAVSHGLVFINDASGDSALRRATTWLDGTYRPRFPGIRAHGRNQALQWPRSGATDADGNQIAIDEIPREIIAAACEAAIREYATPGALSPDVTLGEIITSASVTGAVSVQYKAEGGIEGQRPIATVIDDILAPLLGNRPNPRAAIVGGSARA